MDTSPLMKTSAVIFLFLFSRNVFSGDWINPAGGDFFNPANWSSGVPAPVDFANFNLSSSGYTVLMSGTYQNSAITVGNDNVNLALDPLVFSAYVLTGGPSGYSLVVGNNSGDTGVLNFSGGALVTFNTGAIINGISIGEANGASGTLSMTGAALQAEGDMRIGRFGSGTFNLLNSTADTTGNTIFADRLGSTGSSLIDASTWINTGEMRIGSFGQGDLSIVNGSTVTTTGSFSIGGGGTGMVDVVGVNSRLEVGQLFIGETANGNGTLNINQGGRVTANNDLLAGFLDQSTGNINISDIGSSLTLKGSNNFIGQFSSANVNIINGGKLISEGSIFLGGGTLGNGTSGSGIITITGAGSSMTTGSTGILVVGSDDLSNPSIININNGASADAVNATINKSGVLDVSNSSFTTTSATSNTIQNDGLIILNNGVINSNINNDNTVDVSGSSITTVNGDFVNNGSIKTTGTTFQVNGTFTNNGSYISDPSINIFNDLIISENGFLFGGEGDEFVINGDFTNNSLLNTEWSTELASLIIQGAGLHDIALGSEDFGSGGVANNFSWGSFRLESGVSVNLLDDIAGDGSALYVGIFDLADGVDQLSFITSAFDIFYDPTLTENNYLSGQDFILDGGGMLRAGTSVVPLPTSIWLFGSGLIGLIGLAKRKRSQQ